MNREKHLYVADRTVCCQVHVWIWINDEASQSHPVFPNCWKSETGDPQSSGLYPAYMKALSAQTEHIWG